MLTMTRPEIDLDAMRAAIVASAQQPEKPTFAMERLEANPTLAEALNAALNKLYPGDSKTAKDRRQKILQAIADELGDLYVYGIDLGGYVPIGDPIILGNASIEVDGYGNAVQIFCDGGRPMWDHE